MELAAYSHPFGSRGRSSPPNPPRARANARRLYRSRARSSDGPDAPGNAREERQGSLPRWILLATDGSEDAALAARAALDLSEACDAELHVVHVWTDARSAVHPAAAVLGDRPRLRKEAGGVLREQAWNVRAKGGEVARAHLRRGLPAEEIVILAEELAADLVVVGSRGRGAIRQFLEGSVSEGVIRLACCPTLIVRGGEGAWPPTRVVVGEDFSEDSGAAVRLAVGIAGLFEARTLLLHAYPLQDLGHKAPISGVFRVNGEVRATRGTLEGMAREIERETGQLPEVRVSVGDAAACLLEAAGEEAGMPLVAVGVRGLGTLESPKVGGVCTKVVRGAGGPVLIHRRPGDRGGQVV
ncbi:MAG TPA: universal stress protein [Rubrobacter sp.]|nr:universal stress protein [Rubrobacter sp.]